MQTSKNGAWVIYIQEFESEVHKSWPSSGEVILEDSLKDGDKLLADEAFGGSKNRQKAVSHTSLLIFGDWGGRGLGRVTLIVVP